MGNVFSNKGNANDDAGTHSHGDVGTHVEPMAVPPQQGASKGELAEEQEEMIEKVDDKKQEWKNEPLYPDRVDDPDCLFYNVKLRKHDYYKEHLWPQWRESIKQSPANLLMIPGAMGSELWDSEDDTVIYFDLGLTWKSKRLYVAGSSEGGLVDGFGTIIARDTIQLPIRGDFYRRVYHDPELGAGKYAWDWREDKVIEAKRLAQFFEYCMEDPQLAKGINLCCHSDACGITLYLLGETRRFDKWLKSITFVTPIFGGVLNPLQILEYGNGIGTFVDILLSSNTVQQVVMSCPGTFQQLVAPAEYFVTKLPLPDGETVELAYPVRRRHPDDPHAPQSPVSDGHDHQVDFIEDVYDNNAFTNKYASDRREAMLQLGRRWHNSMFRKRHEAVARPDLRDKINVVVGMNSKTQFMAEKGHDGVGWLVHSFRDSSRSEEEKGMILNGDGIALIQASFLPGLDRNQHWAYIAKKGEYAHSLLPETDALANALKHICKGEPIHKGEGLEQYDDFITRVDFGWELLKPGWCKCTYTQHLDYIARAQLRSLKSPRSYMQSMSDEDLNPVDPETGLTDEELLERVHTGTLRALKGEKVEEIGKDLDIDPTIIVRHIMRLIAPQLSFTGSRHTLEPKTEN